MEERKNIDWETPLRVSAAGLTDEGPRLGELGLEGMVFHAFHGCFEQERKEGAAYRVDLRVWVDMQKAIAGDALEDTVDVQRLYDIVAAQMAVPRNLLETVAGAILKEVRAVPGVCEAEVTVCKQRPPLQGSPAGESPVCEQSYVKLRG